MLSRQQPPWWPSGDTSRKITEPCSPLGCRERLPAVQGTLPAVASDIEA